MPHLAVIVISAVTSMLAMGMAYFISVANSELDPLNAEPAGQAHHRCARPDVAVGTTGALPASLCLRHLARRALPLQHQRAHCLT